MDPNTTLSRMVWLAGRIHAAVDSGEPDERVAELADELATAALALDGWISRGGFLPKEWQR